MRLRLLFFIFSFVLPYTLLAQTATKANRYFNEALVLKAKKQTEKACTQMELAVQGDPTDPDGYSLLGQWYYEAHKTSDIKMGFRLHLRRHNAFYGDLFSYRTSLYR